MEAQLNPEQAQMLAQQLGWARPAAVRQVHAYNHVYQVVAGADGGYLKCYTKDWYGGDLAATAGCVEHEVAAWELLRTHGLATPEVLLAEYGCENVLGRPFVFTRALPGTALTGALLDDRRDAVLHTLGAYLRRMHDIRFDAPGYIMAGGPDAGLASGWQHSLWRFEVWQRNALDRLEREAEQLPGALYRHLRAEFAHAAPLLGPAYAPPRFTHGDCWASQFFVEQAGDGWQITGVVDMEVASAGDAESDFVHLFLELGRLLPPATRWWEHVFAGYGPQPARAAFRLRLLATSEPEFAAAGWPGPRAERLDRLLAAHSWDDLLRP